MAYSKQTWDTTSYVNPTRMNHIEDGIEAVDGKTASDIAYSSSRTIKNMLDSTFVSVTPNQSDVTIKTNKSYRMGNLLVLCVKGTSTNAHSNQSLFLIDGAGTEFNCQDMIFGAFTGGEWSVSGVTYGYMGANGSVIVNNSAGGYFHINVAVPIALL